MTEELNFGFYLILMARCGYDSHIGQNSLILSNALSLLVTLLYIYMHLSLSASIKSLVSTMQY